jgi:hypothetical protein
MGWIPFEDAIDDLKEKAGIARDAIAESPLVKRLAAGRMPAYLRPLYGAEIDLARKVFKATVPYDAVLLNDGKGMDGRPFTIPSPPGFGDSYWLFMGDAFRRNLALLRHDQGLLIHELTHVWQGENSGLSYAYVFESGWHQHKYGDAAYDYGKKAIQSGTFYAKPWSAYNPEQQAAIVEDWFLDDMKDDWDGDYGDPRYRYIAAEIRKEHYVKPVRPLPGATLEVKIVPPSVDPYLVSLLQVRYRADDRAGYVGRLRKLEEVFRRFLLREADELYARLERRKAGDQVSMYFYDHLSRGERAGLLQILRDQGTVRR